MQGRYGLGEAVIAVPQQAEEIESGAQNGGAPPSQIPERQADQKRAQQQSGEVPQVVEGAVKDQLPGQTGPGEGVVINFYRIVQTSGNTVQDQDFFRKGSSAAIPCC